MEQYAAVVESARDDSVIRVHNAVTRSEYHHDLQTFFADLAVIPDIDLQVGIARLLRTTDDAVIAEAHTSRYGDTPQGLGFWFPPTLAKWDCDEVTYEGRFDYLQCDLDIVAESAWVDCLMNFYTAD